MVSSTAAYLDPSTALDVLSQYETQDGLSAAELMGDKAGSGGLTYNDFLVLPGKIDFAASEVTTESRITRNVVLKAPFMSSPMDTVTEGEMAVSMAVGHLSSHPSGSCLSWPLDSCLVVLVSCIITNLRRARRLWSAL